VQTTTDPAGRRARLPGVRALRTGFLLAILFLATGYTYVAFAELSYLSSAGRLGPGFMPRLIGMALIAMCALSLHADLKGQPDGGETLSPGWRSAAVLAALSGAFIVLLELLGGLASMIAFMAASLWLLNPRRPLQNALIAVLLPVFIQVVFAVWLRASMPKGLLPLPF
jgi:hypothetical protein